MPAYSKVGTTWSNETSTAYVIQGSTSANSDWEEGMGNWYTFNTATAGTGASLSSSTAATSSICPKGWQLPAISGSKSFYNLLNTTYSISSSDTSQAASSPIFLTYAGYYYHIKNGIAAEAGTNGYYQINTAYNKTTSYDLNFQPRYFNAYNTSYRGLGKSVRCVAR